MHIKTNKMSKRRTLIIKISGLNIGDKVPFSWYKKDSSLNKLINALCWHEYLVRGDGYKYYVIKKLPMNIRHKDLIGSPVDRDSYNLFLYNYWVKGFNKHKGKIIPVFYAVLSYVHDVQGAFETTDVIEAFPHCNAGSIRSYLSHFKSAGIIFKRHGLMYVDKSTLDGYITINEIVNEGNARKDEIEREIAKSKGQEVFDETKVDIKELQFLAMKAGLIK